ncbi:MAG: hypothetical protein AABZ47_13370, partial [Planctomycetota bacterium]
MAEQNLQIHASERGAKETADSIGKIAEAHKAVGQSALELADAEQKLAEAFRQSENAADVEAYAKQAAAKQVAKEATEEFAAAEQKLADAFRQSENAKSASAAGDQKDALKVFIASLNQAFPGIERFTNQIGRASGALGRLAQSGSGVKDIFGGLLGAITKNFNALLLFASVGAVVAGIVAIA